MRQIRFGPRRIKCADIVFNVVCALAVYHAAGILVQSACDAGYFLVVALTYLTTAMTALFCSDLFRKIATV